MILVSSLGFTQLGIEAVDSKGSEGLGKLGVKELAHIFEVKSANMLALYLASAGVMTVELNDERGPSKLKE